MRYRCPVDGCGVSSNRSNNIKRHFERCHINNEYAENCLLCGEVFTKSESLQKHIFKNHLPSEKFLLNSSAFSETVAQYRLVYPHDQTNFNAAQAYVENEVERTIRYEASRKTLVKVSLIIICEMCQIDPTSDDAIRPVYIPFRSTSFVANALKSGLTQKIRTAFRQQENALEEFCQTGSNWVFNRALLFDLEISATKPLVIGSGKISVKGIKHKKDLFNPNNSDQKCFLRCVHYLLKCDDTFKHWEKKLNLKGIKFPIDIPQIHRFVKNNPKLDLKINILVRNLDKEIYPFESNIGNGQNTINLLMMNCVDMSDLSSNRKNCVKHFLGIKDVNNFLRTRYTTAGETYSYKKCFFCTNCFKEFGTEKLLQEHVGYCITNRGVVELTPDMMYKCMKFVDFQKTHMQDFIGFLDFECLLKPQTQHCDVCSSLRCKCDKSFTEITTTQEPIAFSFVVVNAENKIMHEKTYVGEDAAEVFVDHLIDCWDDWLEDLLRTKYDILMDFDDTVAHKNATHCYMCKVKLSNLPLNERTKCADHNHYNSAYLGAACWRCNIKRRKSTFLPIFLHNGSKYDFHFIIKALNNKKVGKINVVPFNGEHFRCISFRKFKFLDSLAFLQSSLAELSSNLSETDHDYPILKDTFLSKTDGVFDQEKFDILLKKSFFPYEFCTDLKLMEKTTKLPKQEDFYSTLSETVISKEDYKFAKHVWKVFKCKNLLDYTKIYCKLDTILLAEVFQKFRSDMKHFSGLDPSHYISLPGFAFDSMLKITKCELAYLRDIDMVHFIESAIRGGVSFINNRHLEIENDDEELIYIDCNVRKFLYFQYMCYYLKFFLFFRIYMAGPNLNFSPLIILDGWRKKNMNLLIGCRWKQRVRMGTFWRWI